MDRHRACRQSRRNHHWFRNANLITTAVSIALVGESHGPDQVEMGPEFFHQPQQGLVDLLRFQAPPTVDAQGDRVCRPARVKSPYRIFQGVRRGAGGSGPITAASSVVAGSGVRRASKSAVSSPLGPCTGNPWSASGG